jgi:DNA-binding winged helix-turn-helix (wHTH) protein
MMEPLAARFVRFGRFALDLDTDRLLDAQTPVAVPPKAIAILKTLVLNRDRAVTKDELLQTVWPDTVVEEANLSQQIYTLRKLFNDDPARPAFIATIPRLGYRFVADVSYQEQGAPIQSRPAPTAAVSGRQWVWRVVPISLLATAALAGWIISRRAETPNEQIDVALPTGVILDATRGLPGVSPDGKLLALVVQFGSEQIPAIWVKAIGRADGQILPGTEGAEQPFWSWDSRRIGFFGAGRLQTIGLAGGPPHDLAGVEDPKGAAWLADDTIIYAPGSRTPLWSVPAAGGVPASPLTTLDPARRDVSHRWPAPLPDAKRFAVLVWSGHGGEQGVFVGSNHGGPLTRVSSAQSPAQFLAGHMLFILRETLVAQPIDLSTLRLAGDPVPIAKPVGRGPSDEAAFATSPAGTLSFVRTRYDQRLELFSGPDYHHSTSLGNFSQYGEPAVSPDGTQVAFCARNREHGVDNMDVYVIELATGHRTRVTLDEAVDVLPVWSPDSRELLFRSNRSGSSDLYRKRLNTGRAEELVLPSPLRKDPTDWSRDGRTILFNLFTPEGGTDVWRMELADNASARPLIAGPGNQRNARFSPDGRFVVFISDENGTPEVLVESLEDRARWRVAPGTEAYWRDDSQALFLVGLERDIESVAITRTLNGFSFDRPVPLFAPDTFVGLRNGLAPDRNGQFFVVTTVVRDPPQPATVVLNWRPER